MAYDPSQALTHLTYIMKEVLAFKKMTPQLQSRVMSMDGQAIEDGHGVDPVLSILNQMKTVVLAKYGEDLWRSADNMNRSMDGRGVFKKPKSLSPEDSDGVSD